MITKIDVFYNLIWKFAERCGAQFISFGVAVILARLLMPADYGIIALVMVFIAILQVFTDSGLGAALIQKKDADELDFSSVFMANIVVSIVLYLLVWCISPYIAIFYGNHDLILLIRVVSIVLLISGLRNVQQAYVSRNMLFKRFFYSTIGASVLSAIVGIWMAYRGCGVWALAVQQLVNAGAGTVILWITVPWRPQCIFSLERLKLLFSYGWKLLVSALLDTGYNQMWQLIIGKVFTTAELAFFNQGQKFPNVIVTNINASIDSVLLPTLSNVQNDRCRVRDMTRRAIKTSIFIMSPMMMILAFSSINMVTLVLTEKWLPCVPFLFVFCIDYMFWPVHTANLNAINALGRSDVFLKLELLKKALGISVVCLMIPYGVMAMAYGILFTGAMSQIINSWPNRKLLGYGYFQQVQDFLPSILLAVLSGIVSYLIGNLLLPLWLVFIFQIGIGLLVYLMLARIFQLEAMMYLLNMVKMTFTKILDI